jgi:predicted XRE-type DNA-binding protein
MSNQRFTSAWDAIEDTPEEAENMRLRSNLVTAAGLQIEMRVLDAPNEASRAAIAEGDQIIKSRRARFATADALLNDLEEAIRK